MTQLALFDVAPPRRTDRRPDSDLTHILMPCMAWACGGDIVTKGGHIAFLDQLDRVTCPDCLALDPEELRSEQRRQQGKQAVMAQ